MTWFCQSCVYFFLFNRNEEEDSCFCVSVRMLLLHNFFQLHRKQDCLRTSLSHRLQVWDTCVMLQWKNNTRAAHFPHNCRFKFVEKNKTLITCVTEQWCLAIVCTRLIRLNRCCNILFSNQRISDDEQGFLTLGPCFE